MNTAMWEHPLTAQQVEQLKGFGYTEIPCVVKKLVCGDEGQSFCPFAHFLTVFLHECCSSPEGTCVLSPCGLQDVGLQGAGSHCQGL